MSTSSELKDFSLHNLVEQMMAQFKLNVSENKELADEYLRLFEGSVQTPRTAAEMSVPALLSQLRPLVELQGVAAVEFEKQAVEINAKSPHLTKSVLNFIYEQIRNPDVTTSLSEHAQLRALERNMGLTHADEALRELKTNAGDAATVDVASMVAAGVRDDARLVSNIPLGDLQANAIRQQHHKSRVAGLRMPAVPAWVNNRPYLRNYMPSDWNVDFESVPELAKFTDVEQERLLVEDLLNCFMGLPGEYIQPHRTEDGTLQFALYPSVNASLAELTRRSLELANDYDTVARFSDARRSFEYGQVSQALCGALRNLIEDYMGCVCELDSQHRTEGLSLSKLWCYMQPLKRKMTLLAQICDTVTHNNAIGGALLSILHAQLADRAAPATGSTAELCLYILHEATTPYFAMLQQWLRNGRLLDPFREFMIKAKDADEARGATRKAETDLPFKRYSLRSESHIPSFLYAVKDKILNCGAYVNVLTMCGESITRGDTPSQAPLTYDLHEHSYMQAIERSYDSASRRLLQLLLGQHKLESWLVSFKHYFLLDSGDFLLQFLDCASDELKQEVKDIAPYRLQNLLDFSLRLSSIHLDPNKDRLKVRLSGNSLESKLESVFARTSTSTANDSISTVQGSETRLSGYDVFAVHVNIEFPLTLVFTATALNNYKLIFRRLFYAHYLEQTVARFWLVQHRGSLSAAVNALRHRLLTWLQTYLYYVSFEVIEPNWHRFKQRFDNASTVDEIITAHHEMLLNTIQQCMLTDSALVRAVQSLFALCLAFFNSASTLDEESLNELRDRFNSQLDALLRGIELVSNQSRDKTCWQNISSRLFELIVSAHDVTF